MPFLKAASIEVQKLKADDPTRIVLQYLLKHGVGSHNSKPWAMIEKELKDNEARMTQTDFQQTILKKTRAGEIFIGSTDQGKPKGYFLIKDRVDAVKMRDFYCKRIAAEQANLQNLEKLMLMEWPQS